MKEQQAFSPQLSILEKGVKSKNKSRKTGLKKFATLLPNNWLVETPEILL
ncbi:hypothetical protein J7J00_23045 [Bacillus sp. ISL-4]|nr:hypothetical protein [Bacillus sp. ISL-4]MBT2668320.1 hypothetical protein [Bacillus sp. ISL-4]MBT2671871.1 hypothetical protein [Streptomyces sp. ISL-14]